jgi:hypothetical protein
MVKVYSILVSTLFCVFNAYASYTPVTSANSSPVKNEIGVILYSVTNIRGDLIVYNKDHLSYNFLNGIFYKRIYGEGALRLSLDFFSQGIAMGNGTGYLVSFSRKAKYGELRIGYETRLFKKYKLQPFIAQDIFFVKGKVHEYAGMPGNIVPGYMEWKYNFNLNEVGMAISPGVRFQISKGFSISAESGISISYMMYRFHNPSIWYQGIRSHFDPLRAVTVHYHF